MAENRIKVGILGGTFDPIHIGHLLQAEAAYEAYGLDRVLLIPTGHSYLKDNKEEKVLPSSCRYDMTLLAAESNPHFEVSDIEIMRPGNSYTADTLKELQDLHPNWDLYYIVGADTLLMMRKWVRPQEIFNRCTILVAQRRDEVSLSEMKNEINALERDFGAKILPLNIRNIEVSSTEIRERIRQGKSILYLVSEPVLRYINKHSLYL